MLMGLSDMFALAKTPEQKERMRETFIRLRDVRDEDIDFSDIPPITDFSRFRPAKPYLDKIREHNKRVNAELERKKLEESQKVNHD